MMQVRIPERLAALPPYLFVEIDRKLREARAAGHDLINFGIGDPDQPTPAFVVERMHEAIRDPSFQRYPNERGSAEFRAAAAAYMKRRFGVALDPDNEILALIGSKEGLGHLPLAVVERGQTVLVPEPGYPVYRAAAFFAGAVPVSVPLRAERGWLPDLGAIPAPALRDAALMFLNYPNNPTAAVAPPAFFGELVAFARKHEIVIAQDAAYADVYLSDERPRSLLETPGARDVAVEFHSLSKTFNMTGWRIGFAAGHADVIAGLARVKANVDSGVFTAIQEAGRIALDGADRLEIEALRDQYRERAGVLCAGLKDTPFRVSPPAATFYVWAAVPAGYSAMETAARLLDAAHVVAIPGTGFGEAGEGYIRFALTVESERIREAAARIASLKW